MAVQKVEHHLAGRTYVPPEQQAEPRGKARSVDAPEGQQVQASLGQAVVHDSVVHVPAQKLLRAVPDLAYYDGVRLCRLDGLTETAQKTHRYLVGHVQPPAIRAEFFYPVAPDAAEVVDDLVVVRVQLRHIWHVREGAIVALGKARALALDKEPVPVGRFSSPYRGIHKDGVCVRAVIEYTVEHNLHAPLVRRGYERAQGLVPAETFVYFEVILDVVLVVADGLEHRSHVYTADAQLL